MSLLIKGLDIPKVCGNYIGKYTLCVSEDGISVVDVDGKLYKCVEIQTHGTLVDVNDLREAFEKADFDEAIDIMGHVPVILRI